MAKTRIQNSKISHSLVKFHGRDEPDAGLQGAIRSLLPSHSIQFWKAFILYIQNLRFSEQLPQSYLFNNWYIENCNPHLWTNEAFLLLTYSCTHTTDQGEISLPRRDEVKMTSGKKTCSRGRRHGSLDAHSVHFHVSDFKSPFIKQLLHAPQITFLLHVSHLTAMT